jgi:hypothetical protein
MIASAPASCALFAIRIARSSSCPMPATTTARPFTVSTVTASEVSSSSGVSE